MAQSVRKWGHCLAFRIPSTMARQMNIQEGTEIELRLEGKRMVIEKAAVAEFSHDDLVRALRKSQRTLVDLGAPRGNEEL